MATDFVGTPQTWETRELGLLLEHIIDFRGRTPKKLGLDWGGGTVPALSANNVKMGEVNLSEPTFYGSEALYKRWMTSGPAQQGDVLITMEAPLGNIAQVPDAGRYILSQRVVLLRFDQETTINGFAAHQLRSERVQRNLERWSTGTTATGIQRARLIRVPLSFPPVPEQRKITAILDTVDCAIRKTEQAIAKLKQVKHGLLHDLLTYGIDHNGKRRDPKRHPEQFKESPLGRIPREWNVETLEQVTTAPICYGIVQAGPYVVGGPQVLTIGDLRGDFRTNLHRASAAIERGYARSRTASRDLLVSIKGTIGRLAIVPEWYEGNISRDLARLRFSTRVNPQFARTYFESPLGQRRLELAVVGTTRAEISIHVLKVLTLAVPSQDEQSRIVSTAAAQDSIIRSAAAGMAKLRLLKAALMEDLLTGRVRVTKLLEDFA